MRILAIERNVDGVDESAFTPEMGVAEARVAWDLHQAGVIRELYFHADEPMAVLMLECADVAEAESALASLPMVAAGLIETRGLAFLGVMVFIALLTLGFIYDWRKGVFRWR